MSYAIALEPSGALVVVESRPSATLRLTITGADILHTTETREEAAWIVSKLGRANRDGDGFSLEWDRHPRELLSLKSIVLDWARAWRERCVDLPTYRAELEALRARGAL